MDLRLFAQRKCLGAVRCEKPSFPHSPTPLHRYDRGGLSERPSALRQLAALTANAAEGITGRQEGAVWERVGGGGALLEYL